jgi:hypothetical protein
VIQLTDQSMKAWVQRVLGAVEVRLVAPGGAHQGAGVGLYLMDLVDCPPARQNGRPPLQFGLRYLVTTWADDPEEEHRLLGELAFAALDDADLDVELSPLPAATWAAFGLPPRPSFLLRVPIRRARPESPPKLVRAPIVVKSAPLVPLFGEVIGPNDAPLYGVTVEYPALGLVERTDAKGRFHFVSVPEDGLPKQLRVRLDGSELEVRVDQATAEAAPVVIHFDPTSR